MTVAQPPAGRARQTIRLIQALMVMSVVVPAIGIGLVLWQDRDVIVTDAERKVEQSADILHEHALKVFEIHGLVLDKVAMRTDGLDWAAITESPAVSAFLRGVTANMEYINAVWLIDGDGKVRASSDAAQNLAGLSVEDREYFRAVRDTGVATFISRPFVGRLSQKALFGVARRRSTAAGHFDGVICISVPVQYFERLFRSIDPEDQHRIVLLREDGEVLASDAPPPGEVRRFPANSLLMRAIASGHQNYNWEASPMDGREHFFAWRKLGAYPLYVAYAIDKEVALQPWYGHLRLYGTIGAGAAMALLFGSLLALRYARRELALMQRVTDEADRRVRAETSLQQVRKLEAVGQLTGGVAHDFNNLLTTILGNTERAQRTGERTTQLQCLKSIEHAASNGARLVHHLLAFARKQHLDAQPTDLNQIVLELAEMLQSTIGARIRITTELAAAPWLAMADASQIETAILNIALNARDAMPSGGWLAITTANVAAADPQRPPELEPRDYVVVTVRDTGVGMTEAIRARAFEPFFTTKEVGKGSGLGLSQVYGMAKQSGGTVTVESAAGQGATVRLYIPRAAAPRAAAPAEPEQAEDRKTSDDATVLVVDDDFQVRNFVADSLTESGYRTLEAPDGQTALRMLDDEAVDLAVIDLAMPGMDGRELARSARLRRKDLPVLFITAYIEPEPAEAVLDGPLLMKPFRASTLAKEIRGILARARPSASVASSRR